MARLGRVTGTKVAKPRNSRSGEANVRLLQIQIGASAQTLQLVPQAGEDYNPPSAEGHESLALCVQAGGRWFAIATFDGLEPAVAAGERKLYSTDAGAVKASIYLKADGSIVVTTASGKAIEINGNSKTLVTGSELQTALTGLCAALTAHVHPAHGTPAPSLVGLACDITSAKTTSVKTGG